MKKGDIVLVIFPFTDLSASKRRPALILSVSTNNVILAFITSKPSEVDSVIKVIPSPINNLQEESTIILGKIFTGNKSLIKGKIGEIEKDYYPKINEAIFSLLKF
ncbi:MAG: type II toxin-antitoxin system PemK/MazF family toxin [Ferruginibacter sp.]